MYKKTAALLLACLLGACQSLPNPTAKAQQPNASATSSLYQTTLTNGLSVIIKKDTRAPVVMTQIWYHVGSSDEPLGKGGLSHFLEHLMFKDNTLLTAKQYHQVIAHFGGHNNAFTSTDYTAYFESLPANQYPIALQIEAARMHGLSFDQQQIDTEKKVVQEERRQRTDDNPLAKAYELLLATAMPNSPKSRPVIGSMSDIEGLDNNDLHAWYNSWYRPNNATLVLVGDIEPAEAMVWVDKYFGHLRNAPLPNRQSLTHSTHNGYQQLTSTQQVTTPVLFMAFNVPSISTNAADAYALALLSNIADGSDSARFERHLVRIGLFDNIGVRFNLLQKGDGLFTIVATPNASISLDKAEQLILNELQAIIDGSVGDDELRRAQKKLSATLIFESDSIAQQAQTLGMLSSLDLPLDTLQSLPAALADIDQQSLQQAGKQYLQKDNLTSIHVIAKP